MIYIPFCVECGWSGSKRAFREYAEQQGKIHTKCRAEKRIFVHDPVISKHRIEIIATERERINTSHED